MYILENMIALMYLSLFYSDRKCENIFDRFRYLIMLKSDTTDVQSRKYTKIKCNSDDDLLLKKCA